MLTRRERYGIDLVKPAKQDPQERVHNFNEVYQSYVPEFRRVLLRAMSR